MSDNFKKTVKRADLEEKNTLKMTKLLILVSSKHKKAEMNCFLHRFHPTIEFENLKLVMHISDEYLKNCYI